MVDPATLLDDVERWDRAGRRMASPVWFALLCVGATVLASVPAALLIDSSNGLVLYWSVIAPLTAVASGWYFQTRGAHPPERAGIVVLLAGVSMLAGVLALVWFGSGSFAHVTPWIVLGAGFGLFALAWRSWTAGAVAASSLVTSAIVGITDLDKGEVLLALVVGLVAIVGTFVELVRESPVPAA